MKSDLSFSKKMLWLFMAIVITGMIAIGMMTNITLRSIERNLPRTLLSEINDLTRVLENLAEVVNAADKARTQSDPGDIESLRATVKRVYKDVVDLRESYVFDIYFPVTRETIPDRKADRMFEDYQGNGEVILVVDDVDSQRSIVIGMLEKMGYSANSVTSGEAAVDFLGQNEVDLIILDMIMDPGINGRETYERILKIKPGQKAIITSGYAETNDVKMAQQMGAGQFVKKPFTMEKLGLAVKEELERSSA